MHLNEVTDDLFFIVLQHLCRVDIVRIRILDKLNKQRTSKYLSNVNCHNLGMPDWFGPDLNNKTIFAELNNLFEPATLDIIDVIQSKLQIKVKFSQINQRNNLDSEVHNFIKEYIKNKNRDLKNKYHFPIWRCLFDITISRISQQIIIDMTLQNEYYSGREDAMSKLIHYLCNESSNEIKKELSKFGNIFNVQCSLISHNEFNWDTPPSNSNAQILKSSTIEFEEFCIVFIEELEILITYNDCDNDENEREMKFYQVYFDKNHKFLNMKCIGKQSGFTDEIQRKCDGYTIHPKDQRIIMTLSGEMFIFHPLINDKLSIMTCIKFKSNTWFESFFIFENDVYFVLSHESNAKLTFHKLLISDTLLWEEICVYDCGILEISDILRIIIYNDRIVLNGYANEDSEILAVFRWNFSVKQNKINLELICKKKIQTYRDMFIISEGYIFMIGSGRPVTDTRKVKCALYSMNDLSLCHCIDIPLYGSISYKLGIDICEMMNDICVILANSEILILSVMNAKIILSKRRCIEDTWQPGEALVDSIMMKRNVICYDGCWSSQCYCTQWI